MNDCSHLTSCGDAARATGEICWFLNKLQVKIKVLPVLNPVPCHENVWENGGIALRFLNLGIRRRYVVSLTPRQPYPWGKYHGTNLTGDSVDHIAGVDTMAKRKNPSSCLESKVVKPHSLVTILTQLPRL
jgi:hypothetical protein